MNTSILISVVMPAFNEERWISESIQSILDQSFRDFELIIVDDGSTDKTFEIASSFEDPRVKVYRQENMGPAAARNKALSLVKGQYIALQDADDRSKPERLEKQYNFLENHKEYVAIGVAADYIDKDGVFVYQHNHPEIIPSDWNWIEPPVIHPSVMLRIQALKAVEGYPDIPVSQDTLFLYEISKQGKISNLSLSLYEYRISPYAISRKSREISRIVKQIISEYIETETLNQALIEEVKTKNKKQNEPAIF